MMIHLEDLNFKPLVYEHRCRFSWRCARNARLGPGISNESQFRILDTRSTFCSYYGGALTSLLYYINCNFILVESYGDQITKYYNTKNNFSTLDCPTTCHKLRRDGANSLRRHRHSSRKEDTREKDTEGGEVRIAHSHCEPFTHKGSLPISEI
jgi:hypothetical protein